MDTGVRKTFHLPESSVHYPRPLEYRTRHVKVELDVDFQKKRITGSATLDIDPIRGELGLAHFDAVGLEISKVSVDGAPAEYEHDGSILAVSMHPKAGKRSVRVEYSASPKMGLYFTGPDKEHPEKEVQAWTHSETEEARFWFPCHDHPADKSSSELVLTVPSEFRVISNGKLLSTKVEGGRATFHWLEEIPHSCYLTSFVAGKFGVVTQEARGVKLNYNFPESKREDVLRYFGETPKILEVFEDIIGVKYPYLKYDQTTVEDFVAGGEENLNATTLATNYYADAASEEDFSATYASPYQRAVDLVAHEFAHQWFGDYVTCADWPHAWLNEGFASYFQVLYLEKTRGVDEMTWALAARMELYFEEDGKEYRRPIVERDYIRPDDIFDMHLYPKGAARLHELRFLMGDGAFFDGISLYLRSFALSGADTDDFRKAMEKASGLQLQEFFEQSFYKAGHPEFEVGYSWDEAGKLATLRVRQTQRTEDGTPVFKLPCEVVFYVGGERRSFRVGLDSADQTFTFTLPSKPAITEFDPKGWLLKRVKFDKMTNLLLNQLKGSQDASSRAEAAKELGKLKDGGTIEGLAQAAETEQFWYVRACALKALGGIGTDGALQAVLRSGAPKDRKVRRAVAAALGSFKQEEARKALMEMLEADPSPFVRCEAALGLAKSWPEGALPHLKKAMVVHTVNEVLGEASVEAMGKLKSPEADAVIRESLAYGKPTRVRVGALKAIDARGFVLEAEVPILREMLRHDKEYRVRQILVSLVLMNVLDKRFLDDLKEAGRSDPQLGIRRKALDVYHRTAEAAETSGEISRLRAEVEQLREQNRKQAASPV